MRASTPPDKAHQHISACNAPFLLSSLSDSASVAPYGSPSPVAVLPTNPDTENQTFRRSPPLPPTIRTCAKSRGVRAAGADFGALLTLLLIEAVPMFAPAPVVAS